tara:strand:+ start:7536 stop:8258 length:723 start_codon:yes stop_codon:yes gene_type:complete
MIRNDGRKPNQHRNTRITPGFMPNAEGSALIEIGDTKVICTASIETSVPRWMKGTGEGWLTAEYSMLPRSSEERIRRDRSGKINGRSQEIQRLIGRSLRAAIDTRKLGEKTIIVDCDVLQADGGTRTASITGSFVALFQAIKLLLDKGRIKENPITEYIAAVSVGIVDNIPLLDLNYSEDSSADVDLNIVMTESGKFVEIQGTGEENTFSKKELDILIDLSEKGINNLINLQRSSIESFL